MLPRVIALIVAPFGDGSKNDFRPRAWPRTMWRFTVRCSSGRPYRSATRPCRCHDRIGKDVEWRGSSWGSSAPRCRNGRPALISPMQPRKFLTALPTVQTWVNPEIKTKDGSTRA